MPTHRQHDNAEPRSAIIVGPEGVERFMRDNRIVTIRLDLPQLSIHEIDFDPSFAVPPHSHDHVDAMLVLEGEIELLGEAEPRRLTAGTITAAPPGVRHGFRNPGPGRARVLAFHAPDGGFAAMVRAT